MKWKPIETMPLDEDVLLLIEGDAIQGRRNSKDGYVQVIRLASHGCGCCGFMDEPPTHWTELPTHN